MVMRVQFAPFEHRPPYAHGPGQPLLFFVLATVVKEEEVDEVLELDVEAEEMEEEIVKEEEEAKVVVVTPAGGGGGEPVAQGEGGVEGCGAPPGPAMGPPQTWTPPSSSPARVRYGLSGFGSCGCTTGCWGRGSGYGWTREGLSTRTSFCAWGRSTGRGGGNVSCRGRRSDGVRCPPPPRNGDEHV